MTALGSERVCERLVPQAEVGGVGGGEGEKVGEGVNAGGERMSAGCWWVREGGWPWCRRGVQSVRGYIGVGRTLQYQFGYSQCCISSCSQTPCGRLGHSRPQRC